MREGTLFEDWPIGHKLGSVFGLTIALFLGVAWMYHGLLQDSLSEFERLRRDQAGTRYHALAIHLHLLEARQAEKDFLLHREAAAIERAKEAHEQLLAEASALKEVEQRTGATPVADNIAAAMTAYQRAFEEVADAWRIKGLDHESGLQGRFRDTIHAVETRVAALADAELPVLLLQIRRREKDYLLRGDMAYVVQANELIQDLSRHIQAVSGNEADKRELLALMARYRGDFLALVAQNDAIAERLTRIRATVERIVPLVEKTVQEAAAAEKKGVTATKSRAEIMALVAQMLAVTAILVGILLSLFITRQISSRIFTIVRLAEAFVDAGDERIRPRNEVTLLTRTMARMVATLQDMFMGLAEAAEQLDGVSREMGDRATAMIDQADRVAEAAEKRGLTGAGNPIGDAIEGMQDMTHLVKERSGRINRVATDLQRTVERFSGP